MSRPRVYYNESDSHMAAWLAELQYAKVIPRGPIDTRSIVDLHPRDLAGFAQCHFFAGIGGWAYALHLAQWPAHLPIWTGSCPCQPFSPAGAQAGFDDPRHLWPAWFRLIRHRREPRPVAIVGEQSARATAWMSLVCDNLESENFAVCAAVLGAHSAGAPHLRERFYFIGDALLADDCREQRRARRERTAGTQSGAVSGSARLRADGARLSHADTLANGDGRDARQLTTRDDENQIANGRDDPPGRCRFIDDAWLVNGSLAGLERHARHGHARDEPGRQSTDAPRPVASAGGVDWLPCSDGVARPTQSGLFPLAHGVPARVGRLRGYGNAIVPEVAAEFLQAYLDVKGY